MSYRDVLKVYKMERDLTDDETALLNTLRGMSESERELLAETLGPVVKAKSTKPATKRVIEKCGKEFDGHPCNLTRRARIHHDPDAADFHEFQQQSSSAKSKRASGIAATLGNRSRKLPQPEMCVECGEDINHANHDLDNGGHKFTTDLAGRVNAVLDKSPPPPPDDDEERCTATREGGRICNLLLDHNVHQMKTAMGYHEFVGSETAVGVGGD